MRYLQWAQTAAGSLACEKIVHVEMEKGDEKRFFEDEWMTVLERGEWEQLSVAQRAFAKCYWASRPFPGLQCAPAEVADFVWRVKLKLLPAFSGAVPFEFPSPLSFKWNNTPPRKGQMTGHSVGCVPPTDPLDWSSHVSPNSNFCSNRATFETNWNPAMVGFWFSNKKKVYRYYDTHFWGCRAMKECMDSRVCKCKNIVQLRGRKEDGCALPEDLSEVLKTADKKARGCGHARDKGHRHESYGKFFDLPNKVLQYAGTSKKNWKDEIYVDMSLKKCGVSRSVF